MANTNRFVESIGKAAFHPMLEAGHFPECNAGFSDVTGKLVSFSLFDYIKVYAAFRTIIHNGLKERGYPQGIFSTRLSSQKFKDDVTEIVAGITVDDITQTLPVRLKTDWD